MMMSFQCVLPEATAVALDDSSSFYKKVWKWEWLTKPISFLVVDVALRLAFAVFFLVAMLLGAGVGWSIGMFSDTDAWGRDKCNNLGWKFVYWCKKLFWMVVFKERAGGKSSSQDDDSSTMDSLYDAEPTSPSKVEIPKTEEKTSMMRKKSFQVDSPSREQFFSSRSNSNATASFVPTTAYTQHRHAFHSRTPSPIPTAPPSTSTTRFGFSQLCPETPEKTKKKKKVTFGGHTQVILTKCVLGCLPHESMLQLMGFSIPIGTGPVSEDRVVRMSFDEYEAQRSSIPRGAGYRYTPEERMRITGMTPQQVLAYFSREAMMEEEAVRQANAVTSDNSDECIPMEVDEDWMEIDEGWIDPDL